jgi:ribonucleoside-triphosphate reductase
MRTLEEIEKELAAAREALAHVEGTPTEVYSRIVGYYRSVRNWNNGKREEYSERKLFKMEGLKTRAEEKLKPVTLVEEGPGLTGENSRENGRILLFVRSACPACPSAKAAAGDTASRLGIPLDFVNADTDAGLAEAARRKVFATPTAILFSPNGNEIARAHDSRAISAFGRRVAG